MSLYFIDWVNHKRYGNPDEPGDYLCAFSDGKIEVMRYDGSDDSFWTLKYVFNDKTMLTHWAEILPELHPDYDPSPETQEEVTRVGGFG